MVAKMIEGIPLYISDPEGPRAFLTFTTDITGKWVAGYSSTEGAWLIEPLVKDAVSLEQAIEKLKAAQQAADTFFKEGK